VRRTEALRVSAAERQVVEGLPAEPDLSGGVPAESRVVGVTHRRTRAETGEQREAELSVRLIDVITSGHRKGGRVLRLPCLTQRIRIERTVVLAMFGAHREARGATADLEHVPGDVRGEQLQLLVTGIVLG